jgi:hypothetical protein
MNVSEPKKTFYKYGEKKFLTDWAVTQQHIGLAEGSDQQYVSNKIMTLHFQVWRVF